MDKTIYVSVVNVCDDVVNVHVRQKLFMYLDDVAKNESEAYVVARRNEWL